MNTATYFFSGVLAMGYAVAALYFLRFWRESRDRLFAFFSIGFALLAVQRAILSFVEPIETLYLIRLAANNVLVFIDLGLLRTAIDLAVPRTLVGALAMMVLVFGLFWEAGA